MQILKLSFLTCQQYVNSGYLHQYNRILFIADNHNVTLNLLKENMILRHSRTAVLEKMRDKLALYRTSGFISVISSKSKTQDIKKVMSHLTA